MTIEQYKKALNFESSLHILAKHKFLKDKEGHPVYMAFLKQNWEAAKAFNQAWEKVSTAPAPIEAKKVEEAPAQIEEAPAQEEPKRRTRKRKTE